MNTFNPENLKIGDKVTYQDINLRNSYQGEIVEKADNSLICRVIWTMFPFNKALEYIPNLTRIIE